VTWRTHRDEVQRDALGRLGKTVWGEGAAAQCSLWVTESFARARLILRVDIPRTQQDEHGI
jgi:hypothetical protein